MKPNNIIHLTLVLSGIFLGYSTLYASIMGNNELHIDFTRLDDATNKATWKASWSEPDKLGVTTNRVLKKPCFSKTTIKIIGVFA
jgi:hypothetical protein